MSWYRQKNQVLKCNVTISDVTNQFAVLSVQGPLAHKVLAKASGMREEDWGDKSKFPQNTCQELPIGTANVHASRIRYF
jgi:glycine cleavage system aminomethyltransferase T